MTAVGLPVSRLVNVSVNLTPTLAQFPNFNTCLLLTTDTVIDVVTRMASFASLDAVAEAFGTGSVAYNAASPWFAQNPQPSNLLIGRWAEGGSSGQLIGAVRSASQQLISVWTPITDGSMRVSVNGSVETLTALNFSAVTNLNGVAEVINLQLTGADCAWDSVNQRFVITSSTTGVSSTVSFATVVGTGTDVATLLGMLVSNSGSYVANGVAAQSALDTVVIFSNMFSSQWYGLVIPEASDNDHMAVAEYIEASNPPHFYGVNTQEAGCLVPSDTSNIAYALAQLKYTSTAVQYSSSSAYAIMSLLARILTTNWSANNSTITLMYKQEPGITGENLTETQADALASFHCNVFAKYNNDTAIIQSGQVASGDFIDTTIGADWLASQIQTNGFNALYGTTTKLPQTDAGNHVLATAFEAACQAGVNNGLLAPGQWNTQGFGQLKQGDFLSQGYYVYAPPISSQAQADREARKSVPFQIAAKLAGAIQTVDVIVNINR